MPAPNDWWKELNEQKPGPARIRVSFSRPFTEAEKEHLRSVGVLVRRYIGDKIRVAADDRVYIESQDSESRNLFEAISAVVASSFVNVFPIAVRTFREMVLPPESAYNIAAVPEQTFAETKPKKKGKHEG